MNISYHTWRDYTSCPKKFYLKHIKKAFPTVPVNEYFSLYGKLIARFFEMYCNIWKLKTPYLFPEIILERMKQLWDGLLLTATVNWSAPGCSLSKDQILAQAATDASHIMESPSLNYFLSTQSELGIEVNISTGHTITGRIDFVHSDPINKNLLIFDGKGTNTIGKNISNDQLYWYALLYFLHFKVMPGELGFFYYRLNQYNPIPFNLDILNDFRARVSLSLKTLQNQASFDATPNAKACKYCDYLNSCIEGSQSKACRMRNSRVTGLEGDGLIEFGL